MDAAGVPALLATVSLDLYIIIVLHLCVYKYVLRYKNSLVTLCFEVRLIVQNVFNLYRYIYIPEGLKDNNN